MQREAPHFTVKFFRFPWKADTGQFFMYRVLQDTASSRYVEDRGFPPKASPLLVPHCYEKSCLAIVRIGLNITVHNAPLFFDVNLAPNG